MAEISCPNCRYANSQDAAFCSRCGTGLAAEGAPTASPSGWDLATAAMSQPASHASGAEPLRSDDYAGWWARLGATLLDGLLLLLVFGVLLGGYYGIWYATDSQGLADAYDNFFTYESDPGIGVFWVPLLVYLVVTVAWEVGWLRSHRMAKPGQSICGFRVVTATHPQRISTARSFGRFGAKLLMNSLLGGIAAIISAFTIGLTQKRQALHDLMAGTMCVKTSALERLGIRPERAGTATGLAQLQSPASAPSAPPAAPSPPPGSGPFV